MSGMATSSAGWTPVRLLCAAHCITVASNPGSGLRHTRLSRDLGAGATTIECPIMPEPPAPPVVAVVVASDPGSWFEESLSAFGAQAYPNLSVPVIDAGRDDVTARVAAILPTAYVRRLDRPRPFGVAA